MEKDDINLNKIGCDKIYENISQLNELFYSLTDSLHNFNISTNIEVNRIATIANKLRSYSIYNNEKFIKI